MMGEMIESRSSSSSMSLSLGLKERQGSDEKDDRRREKIEALFFSSF